MASTYSYTFVKSGTLPDSTSTGMVKRSCMSNAKVAAYQQQHSQDVFRRRRGSTESWEFHCTVETPPVDTSKARQEQSVVEECIRAIEADMPTDQEVAQVRVLHYRRDGMRQAITAVKKHFGMP